MSDSSQIPNKVLPVTITNVSAGPSWPYPDGSPWWAGGSTPRPYQWHVDITVIAQDHSSTLTREPFQYNGLDVYPGDWIASNTSPNPCLLVVSVLSKTETSARLLIEDKFRYNTFRDQSQNGAGMFAPGDGIIFTLSTEGMPKLDPLPLSVSAYGFGENLAGRFRKYDLEQRYEFSAPSNGFTIGDVIAVEGQTFAEASSANAIKTIGKVVEAGPGPDNFSLKLFQELIYLDQFNLPGVVGDFLYVSDADSGKYSIVESGAPIAIKLTEPTPCISTGILSDPTATVGDSLSINGISITFTGTSLPSVVTDINTKVSETYVQASEIQADTVISSNLSDTVLGGVFVGVTPPGQVNINGHIVTFSSSSASPGVYGDANDVAFDINASNIPNVSASANNGIVVITNNIGGAINMGNVRYESFGSPVVGHNSATGLPQFTPGSTSKYLKLTQADGHGIILKNIVGNPILYLGIYSADNGAPAVGMSTENGIRKSSVTVVPTIPSRNLLTPTVGDQAYVIDANDGHGNKVGEWGLYLWDGSIWTKISDQDSANTDARSMQVIINYTDTGLITIGTLSNNRKVTQILIDVLSPFDSPTASIEIGDISNHSRLMANDQVDLTTNESYAAYTDFIYDSGNDTSIIANFNSGNSTRGSLKVVVTYV